MQNLIEEVKEINEENDLFGTYQKACAISDFLELDDNKELLSKNNLIAIYGPWGSGKSCLMKTIADKLDAEKFEISWFDTWKYENDDNLAYSLFKHISVKNFLDELKEKGKDVLENAYGILKCFSKGIDINLKAFSFNFGEVLQQAEEIDSDRKNKIEEEKTLIEKMNEFETSFSKLKLKNNKRLVVFLDDLDRCDSENIIVLISAIKHLLSINPDIIFVVGIDKDAITLALKNRYKNDINKAEEYLEKVFPITFTVSNSIQNTKFIEYVNLVTGLDLESANIIFELFNYLHFYNPRHVKKVLRKYSVIKKYLESKNIDLKNKYTSMFVIYVIILEMFYNDEYKHMFFGRKEKIYNKIDLLSYDKNDMPKRSKFDKFQKHCIIGYSEEKKYDICELLLYFSSYKVSDYDLKCIKGIAGIAKFNYDDWILIFEEEICSKFIDFVLNNEEMLNYFYIEDKFDSEKFKKYIDMINDVI